jgi:hypothetical protein
MSFNPKLIDVAIVEQLIQMFKVLEVSCEMVQKHNVEKNSHHLRDGRVSLIRGFLSTFFISAADADRENLLRPQADHRAERLLKARTTIAEEGGPSRGFEFYRLENHRNSRGRANVIDRDLRRHRHQPDPLPHRMALFSLDEEIASSRVVIGRGNRQSVEVPALDVFLDPVAVKVLTEKMV